MVGNNTPIFFIRDPLKFPDFIHTQYAETRHVVGLAALTLLCGLQEAQPSDEPEGS